MPSCRLKVFKRFSYICKMKKKSFKKKTLFKRTNIIYLKKMYYSFLNLYREFIIIDNNLVRFF